LPILTDPKQKREIIHCMMDPWYWFLNYYKTFDKPKERVAGFPDWPYLQEYVYELDKGGKILVEKSRDMMITITTCGYMLYCVQFRPNWSGFVTSRREDEVDDGGPNATTDSIFGIVLFGHALQPEWMAAPLSFTHLRIQNEEEGMGSYIKGESANINVGRSKSVTFKWGDEFAFVPQSERVHAAMSGGAYRTLLYTSTSNLSGNAFQRLRDDQDSGFRLLTYRWNVRPGKDEQWYKKQIKGMDAITRATELDIEYEVNSAINVYPRYRYKTHTIANKDIPDGEVILTFDEGFAHPGALYVARWVDGVLYIVDETYEAGIHIQIDDVLERSWVDIARQKVQEFGTLEQAQLLDGVNVPEQKRPVIVLGPESRAAADTFRVYGFRAVLATKDKLGRIRKVDQLMIPDKTGKSRLLIAQSCSNLIWEIPRYNRRVVNNVVTERPRDGNDHGCDSVACLVEYVVKDDVNVRVSDLDDWGVDGEL
jgi:hypothetical protein